MSHERSRERDRSKRYEAAQPVDARERALDTLTDMYVKDKISLEQYENFAGEIQRASDPDAALRALVASPDSRPSGGYGDSPGESLRRAASEIRDSFSPAFGPSGRPGDVIVSIMSERRVDGRLIQNSSSTSITLMGSTTIDLRGMRLPPSGLHLDLVVVMGETRILVSPGMPVRFSVVPIMGEAMSRADIPVGASREGVLEVGGISLMGSVSVRVVP